jgi:hypothetical protein
VPGDESIWQEYWRRGRPIVVDILLWLTVMAGLLIVFSGLKLMEARGYGSARIDFLENIHFVGSSGLLILFIFDLLGKMLSLMIEGPKR